MYEVVYVYYRAVAKIQRHTVCGRVYNNIISRLRKNFVFDIRRCSIATIQI